MNDISPSNSQYSIAELSEVLKANYTKPELEALLKKLAKHTYSKAEYKKCPLCRSYTFRVRVYFREGYVLKCNRCKVELKYKHLE